MRVILAGCALGLAGLTGTALAQGAPEAAKPEREPFRQISIQTYAAGPSQWPAPPPEMIRRVATGGNPAEWLSASDAPIAAWLKTEAVASVTLALEVGADGRVTGCTPAPQSWEKAPAWAAELCPLLVKRAQLIPALRNDGRPMADRLIFTAQFQFTRSRAPTTGPLIVDRGGLAPAPPPPGDYNPQLKSWPPSRAWLGSVARPPAFKLPVEQPGGTALSGPAIGVVVADKKSGDPECRVVLSSGDPRLDDRACTFARKDLKPEWADTVRFPVRRWPLLLSPQGKAFRVIQPDGNAARRLGIEQAEWMRLRALWRPDAAGAGRVALAGMLGPDGRPQSCRIIDSSGSDKADAAICRLFMTEAKFSPPRDVFGQPGPLSGWVNLDIMP